MSEKAGAFLCFYNFAKLQFSEIQGGLYSVLQGSRLIFCMVCVFVLCMVRVVCVQSVNRFLRTCRSHCGKDTRPLYRCIRCCEIGASTYNIRMDDALAIYRKSGMINKKGVGIMSKDTIIKILITIIALMVFIWLWHIISRMIIGTLILTTSLLSVLISLLIQIVVPAAIIVYAVKWITKVKK